MTIKYNTIDFKYKTKEDKNKIMNKLIRAIDSCPKSFIDVEDMNNKIKVICSSKRQQIEAIVANANGTAIYNSSVSMFSPKMTKSEMIAIKNKICG